jgi:hypothetical protein
MRITPPVRSDLCLEHASRRRRGVRLPIGHVHPKPLGSRDVLTGGLTVRTGQGSSST